jgi:hypothetical protein
MVDDQPETGMTFGDLSDHRQERRRREGDRQARALLHGSAVVAGERLTAKEYIFAWANERLPDLGVVSRIDL